MRARAAFPTAARTAATAAAGSLGPLRTKESSLHVAKWRYAAAQIALPVFGMDRRPTYCWEAGLLSLGLS
jgi:hypothetical protein